MLLVNPAPWWGFVWVAALVDMAVRLKRFILLSMVAGMFWGLMIGHAVPGQPSWQDDGAAQWNVFHRVVA